MSDNESLRTLFERERKILKMFVPQMRLMLKVIIKRMSRQCNTCMN